MPVQIDSANFTDIFGNTNSFYVSNVGDEIKVSFNLRSIIRMSSVGNPLTLDPTINTVQSPTSWLEEGFRVNDWVLVRRYNAGGGLILGEWHSQITYLDDVTADFTAMPEWANLQNQEIMVFVVVQSSGSYSLVCRQDMEVNINHIQNALSFGEGSLIDGESTRLLLSGLENLTIGQNVQGVTVGNQSGQFFKSGSITRIANNSGWFAHRLDLSFVNSGGYDSSWFAGSDCLKLFVKMLWARFTGEPLARSESIYKLEANTGFFNEANNNSVSDSVLIQGINEIDYCVPSTHTIIYDGPIIANGIGAMFISVDENYYKNKPESQTSLTMLIETQPSNNFFSGGVDSELNPNGAGYNIEILNFNQVGTISTLEITFTPNALFNDFFANSEDGNRLFYLWIKCGNLNLLAFDGQLSCAPPVGGPLPMVTDYGYLNHSENVDTITGINTGYDADTEDDIAYYGTFLLEKNVIYDSFSVKLEAFNSVTEDDFTLQVASFSFAGIPISGDGRYLLNESQTIVTTLPNTSIKIEAVLTLVPSLDTVTEYGVSIYYPFLCRWEYWLSLTGVNVDFNPNYNRNWQQYDDLPNWIIRTELQLIKEGLAFVHSNNLIINPYDNEDLIESSIEMFIESSGTPVNFVPENEILRIRSTHINLLENFDIGSTWGMITIEPFESASRFICSTVIDFDFNTSNPLTPDSGLLIIINYPSPNTAVMECLFDSSLINLSNGVKITGKIHTGKQIEIGDKTTAPDDLFKDTSEDNISKTLAP